MPYNFALLFQYKWDITPLMKRFCFLFNVRLLWSRHKRNSNIGKICTKSLLVNKQFLVAAEILQTITSIYTEKKLQNFQLFVFKKKNFSKNDTVCIFDEKQQLFRNRFQFTPKIELGLITADSFFRKYSPSITFIDSIQLNAQYTRTFEILQLQISKLFRFKIVASYFEDPR